jgi:hypothetical protein
MIQPEQLVEGEWAEWYRLTPIQRWLESEKLWQTYLALGGSLDPNLSWLTQIGRMSERQQTWLPVH